MAVALKTRVTNLGGQIVATEYLETRYLIEPDALGNTRSLIDDTGAEADSYTYWPYGEQRTATVGIEFPFKFCGTWGYYTEPLGGYPLYVRARYYRQPMGRWITVDPLWPQQQAYGYVGGNPAVRIDPSGTSVFDWLNTNACRDCRPRAEWERFRESLDAFCALTKGGNKEGQRSVSRCVAFCNRQAGKAVDATCILKWCEQGTLTCEDVDHPKAYEYSCKPCSNKVLKVTCGETICAGGTDGRRPIKLHCNNNSTDISRKCCCKSGQVPAGGSCDSPGYTFVLLLHELVHACQGDCAPDGPDIEKARVNSEWAYCMTKCLRYGRI